MTPPKRVSIQEWVSSDAPFAALVNSGLSPDQAIASLVRVSDELGSGSDARRRLAVSGSLVTAEGVAGIIRLTPDLELEIIPKFLDPESRWQTDFYQLAVLTQHSNLKFGSQVSASSEKDSDLTAIFARNLIAMIRANRRVPLRTYKVRRWRGFEIDGEIDPDEMLLPSDNGFRQSEATFSRVNKYTALIDDALKILATEVGDPSLSAQLRTLVLEKDSKNLFVPRPLQAPGRHRRWQPALDLAFLVSSGFRGSLDSSNQHAPGFYIDTWRAWEELVTVSIQESLGAVGQVSPQIALPLGTRRRGSTLRPLNTTPDVLFSREPHDMVIDAKYKGRPSKDDRIAIEDIYEVLAFLRASGSECGVLIYPSNYLDPAPPIGTVELFEDVVVGELRILGVRVSVQGLGRTGGRREFSSRLGARLLELMNHKLNVGIPEVGLDGQLV